MSAPAFLPQFTSRLLMFLTIVNTNEKLDRGYLSYGKSLVSSSILDIQTKDANKYGRACAAAEMIVPLFELLAGMLSRPIDYAVLYC